MQHVQSYTIALTKKEITWLKGKSKRLKLRGTSQLIRNSIKNTYCAFPAHKTSFKAKTK